MFGAPLKVKFKVKTFLLTHFVGSTITTHSLSTNSVRLIAYQYLNDPLIISRRRNQYKNQDAVH